MLKVFCFLFNLFLPFAPWMGFWFPGKEYIGRNLATGDCVLCCLQILVFWFAASDEKFRKDMADRPRTFSDTKFAKTVQYALTTATVTSFYGAGWFWMATIELTMILFSYTATEAIEKDRTALTAKPTN